MAFHLLQHDRAGAEAIPRALQEAVKSVRHCQRCHTFTDDEVCSICRDESRDARQLCVVETPADQAALERTGSYRGYYYVLMGRISPLDGGGASALGAAGLMARAPHDGAAEESLPSSLT